MPGECCRKDGDWMIFDHPERRNAVTQGMWLQIGRYWKTLLRMRPCASWCKGQAIKPLYLARISHNSRSAGMRQRWRRPIA